MIRFSKTTLQYVILCFNFILIPVIIELIRIFYNILLLFFYVINLVGVFQTFLF